MSADMRRPTPATLFVVGFFSTLAWGVSSAAAQDLTKEALIKSLQCRAEQQECQTPPPPTSHRRGFQPPGRRGITFEPFTKEEHDKIANAAKAGKLPSADVEVYFEYDKADVTPAAQKTLEPLGQALADPKLASNRFVLIGHTDAKGGDGYNQSLSERRAAAVRDHLIRTFAIAPDRLIAYGCGKSDLKTPTMHLRPKIAACKSSTTAW
jgi:outer membrane protein OmpA-like peptidoglycan-associated protein